MVDFEERINILREKGDFSSREEVLSAALRSYLEENPDLRLELAIEEFSAGSVSLNRAAEIAGLSPEAFKMELADRDIDRDVGFLSEEERAESLSGQ